MDHITPHKQATCGCCTGDGSGYGMPGNDQCICFMHQDTPRGRPPKICAYHKRLKVYQYHPITGVPFQLPENT